MTRRNRSPLHRIPLHLPPLHLLPLHLLPLHLLPLHLLPLLRFPLATLAGAIVSLGGGRPIVAQEIATDTFTAVETGVHEAKAKLRTHAAIELLVEDLHRLGSVADRGTAGRRAAAHAEFQALQLTQLARGFADPVRMSRALIRLARSPLALGHPALRDVLNLQVMNLHHELGETARRDAARRELAFLEDWWLLGPFDNERGSGFGRRFVAGSGEGAESAVSVDATYSGKKREVRWRPVPVQPPLGLFHLGAMLRPNRQVLCYVATSLRADRDRDVTLRLGSSEGFEAYLNGARIGGRNVQRRFGFDQDTVVLPLRSGPNLLVLRIFSQEGSLAFAARLRGLGCEPITGITSSATPDDLRAAGATAPRERTSKEAPFSGARTVFARSVSGRADAACAADCYRLAAVRPHYRAEDDTDRSVQDLVRRGLAVFPRDPALRFALATTRIATGRNAAEKEENPRRHDYEAILAQHPDHARTMLSLARLTMDSTGAILRAEEWVRQAIRIRSDSPSARLAHADILEARDLPGLARREIQRGAATDRHGNFLHLARRRLARALADEGRLAEARSCYESLIRRNSSVTDRLGLASILFRVGRRDAGVELLEGTIAANPFDARPRFALSRLREAEGDLDAAMTPLQRWLTICPEDDTTLVELSRLHGLLGSADPQRELLRTAVRLNPNRKGDSRHLEFLESGARPFFADFELDGARAIANDEGPPADSELANDPFYYLLDHRVVHAYRNGTTSEYRHFIVRILNQEGSKRFASYSVGYHWGEQRARLLEVNVQKKTGAVTKPRLRGTRASLPSVTVGDLVEVRYRVDDTAPGFFGDYFGFEHEFARSQPVHRASLVLVLEQGRDYRLQVANGAPQPSRKTDGAGAKTWRFEMRGIPRSDTETNQPDTAESSPLVRVSTYPTWNAFAAWWWNLIRKQSEVSPAIRQKVEELTAGMTNTREKIEAIYRFVTTDVRYEAWEFGVHGYKPYSVPVIFERRHGDCKDKSLLLNSMLSVVGVKAHPVLIHADEPRSRDDLSLPLVSHFNHCISYVEPTELTPGMYLDGTATYHPLDTLPEMDHGAKVLVVRGAEGQIQDVPWADPATNLDRTSTRIRIAPNGDADVVRRMEPTGNQAVWVRRHLGNEPAKQKERLDRILKDDFGAIEITDHSVGTLLDLRKPVRVEVSFRATGLAARQGRGLVLESAIGADSLARRALAKSRRLPLLLGTPRSSDHTIRYEVPPGYRALNLPAPVETKTGFGAFHLRWTSGPDGLTVSRRLVITAHRIAPAEYGAFREFANEVDQASQQVVVIEKEGRPR